MNEYVTDIKTVMVDTTGENMSDIKSNNMDYFETDQIMFATKLWKLIKQAKGTDFNIIKFSQDWEYAENVLLQSMMSPDSATSDYAVELMQLRLIFTQRQPERAKKMGAKVAVDETNKLTAKSEPQKQPSGNTGTTPPDTPPRAGQY